MLGVVDIDIEGVTDDPGVVDIDTEGVIDIDGVKDGDTLKPADESTAVDDISTSNKPRPFLNL